MTKHALWRCDVCKRDLPSGEFLLCDPCNDWYWKQRDLMIALEFERSDPWQREMKRIANDFKRLDSELPVVRLPLLQAKDAPTKIAAIDEDVVNAVVARIDEIFVPETPRGTRLERVGPGLWAEVMP